MSDEQSGVSTPYSYHIFLFPFKWELSSYRKKGKQFDLDIFQKRLYQQQENVGNTLKWTRKKYTFESHLDFNEYTYFYDFVREVLYDYGEKSHLGSAEFDHSDLIRYYEVSLEEEYNAQYIIESGEGKRLVLTVDSISMNIYSTGVGVLVFHLINEEKNQKDPSKILEINELGRRVYPPFLSSSGEDSLKEAQKDLLAKSITLKVNGNDYSESFSHYTKTLTQVFEQPVKLASFIRQLFGENNIKGDKILTELEQEAFKAKCQDMLWIYPALDDRMFVVCWYPNNEWAQKASYLPSDQDALKQKLEKDGARKKKKKRKVKRKLQRLPEEQYGFIQDSEASDFWYKFLFIDNKNKGIAGKLAQRRLLLAHTYDRWVDYGTLYGTTRYSLVCLCTTSAPAYVFDHLKTMYYKIAELLLIQRASILRFSDEITHLTAPQKEDQDGLGIQIRELYRRYIRFVNKIHFRETNAQEQGIAMYQQLRRDMEIERDVKELDQEISELHQYASMLEDNRRNIRLEWLTIIGAVFLIPTFIAGFYGMNVFSDKFPPFSQNEYTLITLSIIGVALSTLLSFASYFKSNKQRRGSIKYVFKILAGGFGVITLFLIGWLLFRPAIQNTVEMDNTKIESISTQADSLEDSSTQKIDSLINNDSLSKQPIQ